MKQTIKKIWEEYQLIVLIIVILAGVLCYWLMGCMLIVVIPVLMIYFVYKYSKERFRK